MCCPFITPFVTHIINSCILANTFPDSWKRALIIPIPKKNNIQDIKDLRPISILPTLSKILEKILDRQIRRFVADCELLPHVQSGFRAGYSCTTALLCVTDDILQASDQGLVTILVLLDFSRAFDTIDHATLLNILKAKGFGNDAVCLIASFLYGRSQSVKLNGTTSSPLPILRGVPQGSILSPILFSLYTSLILKELHYTKAHLYADDCQLYYSFKPSDYMDAVSKINADLANIYNFSNCYNLHINPSKSQILICGNNEICDSLRNVIHIHINNSEIPIISSVTNLGLTMDNTFRFRDHIGKCIQSAYGTMKKLYPHRKSLNETLKKRLCQSCVLSRFTYCSEVYQPCLDVATVNRVQKVQNACLRYIHGIRKFDHISHKLKDNGWLNMKNRRSYRVWRSITKYLPRSARLTYTIKSNLGQTCIISPRVFAAEYRRLPIKLPYSKDHSLLIFTPNIITYPRISNHIQSVFSERNYMPFCWKLSVIDVCFRLIVIWKY